MSAVRFAYRLIRLLFLAYGLWTAFLRSRWFTVAVALWRILRRRRDVRPVRPTAAVMFVDASEPAIYRRVGMRRLLTRKYSRRKM